MGWEDSSEDVAFKSQKKDALAEVPACGPKGHQFDSWSGHKPGLRARSLVGGV